MFFPSPFAQPRSSFEEPVIPPSVDPDEGGFVSVSFNADWLPYVLGALTQLQQPTTWDGDDAAKSLAVDRATLLSNMVSYPIATPPGVTPTPPVLTRYNPTLHRVESSFDGGTTWAANPALDPQKTTYLPPQTGTNADCNSAASEIAWLVRWSELLTTTIAPATTATALAYAQIALFTELAWPYSIMVDVFITASIGLLDAGITAIGNALLSANLDTLLCIINCNLNASHQLTTDSFATVLSQVTSQIGGTDATIINLMLGVQGVGGVNDAMALGLATDDCSGCASCNWCFEWDFTISNGLPGWTIQQGAYQAGTGIIQQFQSANNAYQLRASISANAAFTIQTMLVDYTQCKAALSPENLLRFYDAAGTLQHSMTISPGVAGCPGAASVNNSGTWTGTNLAIAMDSQNVTGHSGVIRRVKITGTGANPFGANNC